MSKKCKKCKKPEGGVPEWVVTYGDMMSLLLCFFILLAAFSELKRDHEYQRVITAVKEAFGYSGGVGVMPTDDPPLRSMIELMETLAMKAEPESKVSRSQDRGIEGRESEVSKLPEGTVFTIGGSLTFEAGSAELREGGKEELRKIAKILTGRMNKIAVRGHASRKPLPQGSEYADLLDLSYYRAKAVTEFLVNEGGLDPRVLTIEARGDAEPLESGGFEAAQAATNRRVEVIMTEITLDQVNPNHDFSDESAAGG
ncbi:MAG: flagellar motor protein MotB [Planctomycetota bacterium]